MAILTHHPTSTSPASPASGSSLLGKLAFGLLMAVVLALAIVGTIALHEGLLQGRVMHHFKSHS